jgi:uncharacterized protein involved in exopolysaccharide biosynthesis
VYAGGDIVNFNLVPSWVYWLIIAALVACVGVEQTRVSNAKATLATEKAARGAETIQRQQLVIAHSNELRSLESTHAAQQRQKAEAYEAQIATLKTAGDAYRADAERLRGNLSRYTSGATRPGETDAAACQRAQDRLPRVGALLAEGIGLEAEGRELVRQRDAEIELLLGQIKTDRAACSQDSK